MKQFLFGLITCFSYQVSACPNCYPLKEGGETFPYRILILGLFILLTYIPLALFYKAAKKYDNQREQL
jgi:hypothetical protein